MSHKATVYVVTSSKHLTKDAHGRIYSTNSPLGDRDKNLIGQVVLSLDEVERVQRNYPMALDTVLKAEGNFPEDTVFQVKQNSDQTEGRGSMIHVAYLDNFIAAFEVARGRGVMGAGDGDIYIDTPSIKRVFSSKEEFEKNQAKKHATTEPRLVYSSYFGLSGTYFTVVENVTESEKIASDPEYAEYLRLKAIFG